MKPKSPEQAAWDAECKRLLKKITRTPCDEEAKRLQEQYRLHVGLRPKPFLPGLREFGDTTTAAFLEGLASSGGTAIVIADEGGDCYRRSNARASCLVEQGVGWNHLEP